MKTKASFLLGSLLQVCLLLFFAAAELSAASHEHHQDAAKSPAIAQAQDAWLAQAKASYPLDTCVISEDKLEEGAMGAPIDYIHKEAGKPDRLVRFCCKRCVKTFNKEPARYLKLIDEAAAAKALKH